MILLLRLGPPCPNGMASILGQCLGIMKNSRTTSADDSNCYWRSDDRNFELAKLVNNKVRSSLS